MIFQHTHAWVFHHSPFTGQPKTLTTRPFREGDKVITVHIKGTPEKIFRRLYWNKQYQQWRSSVHLRTGVVYKVQPGRGQRYVGEIILNDIYLREKAGNLTPDEVLAEGFGSLEEFRRLYISMWGREALDKPAWAIRFHALADGRAPHEVAG